MLNQGNAYIMSENAWAHVRSRSTMVMFPYSEDYVNVLLGIKNDCTLFTSDICLHAVYIMDERCSNHAKAHLPGIQSLKLKIKPHFIGERRYDKKCL